MSTLADRIRPALEIRDSSLEATAVLNIPQTALPQNVLGIPRSCGLLSELELDLTENYDATGLLEMLAEGKVTAQTLLTAFRKRATVAQQCTNCLTELLPQAIGDAKACDEFLKQKGRTMGPLHGLPVSVKEHISVGGRYTHGSFVALVGNRTEEDADVVRTLKRLGAVIFARTNQPQSLMHLETSNNIYGTTVNPRNGQLTAGGSTGGEGVLMAMNATPLGIGGDIGGSIRVPAALNRIYGFVPTVGRISGQGAFAPVPGNDSIVGTVGPFTRSLRDIELFCRAYSQSEAWIDDASLVPGDILSPSMGRQLDPHRPVRVGILTDDGVVSPLPPVRYIIELVRNRLGQCKSVEVVPFTPLDHAEAWRIIAANYFEDGGAGIRDFCKRGDEPLLPLTDWIISQCQHSMQIVADTSQGRKAARDAFRQAYNTHWNQAGIDVLLTPVTPSTAPPHGAAPYWGYTATWNLLQYPAVALPASSFVKDWNTVDLSGETYEPKSGKEEELFRDYSWTAAQGMPVGLQVVAKRFHENMLIHAARIIEEALR